MDRFREYIAQFMAETGIKPTTLGKLAVRDGRFVFDLLRRGRSPGIDTAALITRWMRENRKRLIAERTEREGREGPRGKPRAQAPHALGRSIARGGGIVMPLELRLALPVVTPLLNTALRQNMHQRKRAALALAWHVKVALMKTPGVPAAPLRRVNLRIERHSIGTPDFDGMVGGLKPLIDCLMPMDPKRRPWRLGVIADDGPAFVVPDYHAVRAAHRADQKTVITITEIE